MPQTNQNWKRNCRVACTLIALAMLAGCHQDMWNQPKLTAMQGTPFYADGRASREPVAGTVRYAGAPVKWTSALFAENSGSPAAPGFADTTFHTGKTADGFLADNYFKVDRALLLRGRERYEISCMPCHGLVGDGHGIIAQRGFPAPASFHTDRLREVEDGYIYDVITNGFGRMYSYAARVAPEDRWAIAAYIRALQASQNVNITDSSSPLAQIVNTGLAEQAQRTAAAAHDAQGHGADGHGQDDGPAHDEHGADTHDAGEHAEAPAAN